eukprot:TRINITY_DN7970_c0_g1_i1.p1 TRINITY_DN7970_c0_g1~~TRINITY_DN7970_c0_g1_i1.p1  ORF type:complete len:328 (-),score=46.03 TRINITY_DN7970_c0_g1_i1:29-1012(-)
MMDSPLSRNSSRITMEQYEREGKEVTKQQLAQHFNFLKDFYIRKIEEERIFVERCKIFFWLALSGVIAAFFIGFFMRYCIMPDATIAQGIAQAERNIKNGELLEGIESLNNICNGNIILCYCKDQKKKIDDIYNKINIIKAHLAMKNYKQSLVLLREMINMPYSYIFQFYYHSLSCEAFLGLNKLREAIDSGLSALDIKEDPHVLKLLGTAYQKLEEYEEALYYFNQVHHKDPLLFTNTDLEQFKNKYNGDKDSIEYNERVLGVKLGSSQKERDEAYKILMSKFDVNHHTGKDTKFIIRKLDQINKAKEFLDEHQFSKKRIKNDDDW